MDNTRVRRQIVLPARYRTDNAEHSDEGGLLINSLMDDVLQLDEELEVELYEASMPLVAQALSAGDTRDLPIDDPNAKDPKTIADARQSEYWSHWLSAIHEELEALKAKGVYEEVEALPLSLPNGSCTSNETRADESQDSRRDS